MFTAVQVFPGITHITDAMGVSFTLIEGTEYSILFDTGYGLEDTASFVSTLTSKPLKVLLSHGHHDHVLGARWFSETYLAEEDLAEFRERTGPEQRKKVTEQAKDRNVGVPDDYLKSGIQTPKPIFFPDCTDGFSSVTEKPGGLTVRVIRIPGHTPGSIILHIPEYHLLLTGDNWNPCTWMWFPTSLPVCIWRNNMQRLIRSIEKNRDAEIDHVLCSHQPIMRTGKEIKAFLEYMTDERIASAPAADMGAPINTHMIHKTTEDWTLIFDKDKV